MVRYDASASKAPREFLLNTAFFTLLLPLLLLSSIILSGCSFFGIGSKNGYPEPAPRSDNQVIEDSTAAMADAVEQTPPEQPSDPVGDLDEAGPTFFSIGESLAGQTAVGMLPANVEVYPTGSEGRFTIDELVQIWRIYLVELQTDASLLYGAGTIDEPKFREISQAINDARSALVHLSVELLQPDSLGARKSLAAALREMRDTGRRADEMLSEVGRPNDAVSAPAVTNPNRAEISE